ncbi:MAG: ligase-associated DNA damage response exonuclease [Isosphaeraceae bacterium]
METQDLLEPTELGLYCREGDFFIDPWRPVDRAVVTHAHADHACRGCGRYLTSREGAEVLRVRMGKEALIDSLGYGAPVQIQGVTVSLHPAGHILGSSQIRVERGGRIWVVSGDYKIEPDATCAPFEPVRCHVFVSESTFGLPIYRWPAQGVVFEAIRDWWRTNQAEGRASVLFAYALGKAQRLIAGVGAGIGPIYTHGAVEPLNAAYRASGVPLPETAYAGAATGVDWSRALIVAPPSAQGSPWMRRFGPVSTGFASGWMRIRGARRRRSVDRGFVLSDHADWPGLLSAIEATGAEQVWLTHGYTSIVARWLRERGREAGVIATRYEGERDDTSAEEAVESTPGALFPADQSPDEPD